ncbi:ribosome biogenesis GTPase Der [Phototrophicus methaneseepsis]|uniref:GTPase Der n=1 Tax=Phototrophicus methaneseepsis TaxID=2710758 RepID=A0A7S8ICP0_9CHLR|nr:ribosome biogenesis GTPase Der [Phototrophicus methaneseepsis]QPC81750.1 ribosome biogenesis GTPase Der [Phototrophicus methaneseepsis]
MARKPIVALVGRPNVGKSSLFNRLVGERMAVIHDIPGTTRDRLQGQSFWNGITFHVIDTGGIEVYQAKGTRDENPLAEGSIDFVPQIESQALAAVQEADIIIMVVDILSGMTAADETIAEILRRTDKPVIVAANKADDKKYENDAYEFYALGLGQVIPISSIHGAGVGDMLDVVTEELRRISDDWVHEGEVENDHLHIAIVGRPNAGKSTLLNKLIGEERAIVSPIAGTTRDAIDTTIRWHGEDVTIIDTAGMRRRGRIEPGVEKFSVVRAFQAIERAQVAILVLDGEMGVTEQDEHIAGYVIEEYKSLVIVVNKWDAVEKDAHTMNDYMNSIRERLHFVPYAPVIFISALNGQRIHQVLEVAHRVYENRFIRISTSELNQLVRDALERHAPPNRGVRRLKIFYATQVRTDPPLFLFHINDKRLLHFTYERYLENRIRESFSFEGTPIRLSFRERKNNEE